MPRLLLNGSWETGLDRHYTAAAPVPGLAGDPAVIDAAARWYRREVALPEGSWTHATLELAGARFRPAVFVNGEKVSEAEGGMALTFHPLAHAAVRPGGTFTLEVALASLNEVPVGDASRIPPADRWRSNVSSCLWDDVRLHLHGSARIAAVRPRLVPATPRVLNLDWQIAADALPAKATLTATLEDLHGSVLATRTTPVTAAAGHTALQVGDLPLWSPEQPVLHTLRVHLAAGDVLLDEVAFPYAPRDFRIVGKHFHLNGQPVRLRAGSVVWHRWCRDPEAGPTGLAWDAAWFERHIIQRLKSHGANTLRFHLGMPPESLLELCDRHGLLVQAEWSFFHNVDGTRESLLQQWRHWLDLCARHPSVVLVHAWNEHEGPEVQTALEAITELAADYPQFVYSHKDVMHPHKYWWSLFENVGVYYDSVEEFPQPIMVDEFGGNYLDGDGNPGGYPTVRESMLRFLGRNHTAEQRLELQCDSYARVAEYWRRLAGGGAAGFSPFCILGSREDGNHLFMGPIASARPKPVWSALTAAYAPVSVSLDLWDRNFLPGQAIPLAVQLFNETSIPQGVQVQVRIAPDPMRPAAAAPYSAGGRADYLYGPPRLQHMLAPHSTYRLTTPPVAISDEEGHWMIEAEMENPPGGVGHAVVSRWGVQTVAPTLPPALVGKRVGLLAAEPELVALLKSQNLADDGTHADVLLTSRVVWDHLPAHLAAIEDALRAGRHVVMLDVGPRPLGEGYPTEGIQRHLQGQPRAADHVDICTLPLGLQGSFRLMPEPESCLHPAPDVDALWWHLPRRATQLWNGLKGGLIVPAADMELVGLAPEAFLQAWTARGADAALIRGEHYMAYELAGFFDFSVGHSDAVGKRLRDKVRFLVDDAPALAQAINPNAPLKLHDLSALYRASSAGQARELIPLANAGKNLTRVPVMQVNFATGSGCLVLSQLLTAGRLAPGFGENTAYGIRFDPAAVQMTLNMLARVVA